MFRQVIENLWQEFIVEHPNGKLILLLFQYSYFLLIQFNLDFDNNDEHFQNKVQYLLDVFICFRWSFKKQSSI